MAERILGKNEVGSPILPPGSNSDMVNGVVFLSKVAVAKVDKGSYSRRMAVTVRRKVTVIGILRLMCDIGEILMPAGSRLEAWKKLNMPKTIDWEKCFPSEIERIVGRLARHGWVEKREMAEGTKVIITEAGRKQILLFQLEELRPKTGKWDGKWRMVFFDVEEEKKRKRDGLRRYLKRLGFWQMQKSVWVYPFDCDKEVKYLREVLNVPHEVKLGVLEKVENDRELREIFGL